MPVENIIAILLINLNSLWSIEDKTHVSLTDFSTVICQNGNEITFLILSIFNDISISSSFLFPV